MENSTIECLKTRRSIKAYNPDRMPSQEQLDAILEAGMNAPTGRGLQSPVIAVITDKTTRDRLSKLNAQILVIMAVLADKTVPTHVYDGSLVMGNLMNAAHALGLGSCWIHRAKEIFDSDEGKAMLDKWGLRGEYEGIGFCTVGYVKDGYSPVVKPRKAGYVIHVE